MKKITLALFTLILVCSLTTAEAQSLSKKERKALKKEIKTYKKNPEKWVKMKNRHKTEVVELNEEITSLKAELTKIEKLEAQNKDLAEKLAVIEGKYKNLMNAMPSTALPGGTVYQVQMGFFKELNLVSFNNKLKTVKAEDVDGAKRYVIGYFENMMDAVQFSNDIKTLGISDAFVTQYVDGNRIMNFDALKSIGK